MFVFIRQAGFQTERNVREGQDPQQVLDDMLTAYNIRKTTKTPEGDQRGVMTTPIGKSRIVAGIRTK